MTPRPHVLTCPVCFTEHSSSQVASLACGHNFCFDCWQEYLKVQVEDGKGALDATCPAHECALVVPSSVFEQFLADAPSSLEKFRKWRVRSYVDDNPAVRWCSSPEGCTMAAVSHGSSEPTTGVRCSCGFHYCWDCGAENHQPASCQEVEKWSAKNSTESE